MHFWKTADASILSALHAEQSASAFTYAEVGATSTDLPLGYKHDVYSWEIARGRDAYERAAAHVLSWGLQRSLGLRVHPEGPVADGVTVILTTPFIHAATRVVYVVDEPSRQGFAYGTLPLHPEIGEEYFEVSIDDHDVVRFHIRAFSRPRSLLARLGGPLTRVVQRLATLRYRDSVHRSASA